MWNMLWPMIMVVMANCVYNVCAKSTPDGVSAFGSLTVTYLTAALLSGIMFFVSDRHESVIAELSKLNWTSFVLGASIVALEFGYINIYRAGWKVSTGSLVANICLACCLLCAGLLLYKETISLRQVIGMIVCVAGLILIGK